MSPPKREGIGGAAGRLKEPLSSGRAQLLKRMADMVGFDNAACHRLFAINRSRIRLGAADAATVEIEHAIIGSCRVTGLPAFRPRAHRNAEVSSS